MSDILERVVARSSGSSFLSNSSRKRRPTAPPTVAPTIGVTTAPVTSAAPPTAFLRKERRLWLIFSFPAGFETAGRPPDRKPRRGAKSRRKG